MPWAETASTFAEEIRAHRPNPYTYICCSRQKTPKRVVVEGLETGADVCAAPQPIYSPTGILKAYFALDYPYLRTYRISDTLSTGSSKRQRVQRRTPEELTASVIPHGTIWKKVDREISPSRCERQPSV